MLDRPTHRETSPSPAQCAAETGDMQRAVGRAALGLSSTGGKQRLTELQQAGCLKLMLPRNHRTIPDVVLINTAGGLTGGDRLSFSAQLDGAAQARIATQTAERIYRRLGSSQAQVDIQFRLDQGGRLDWLPQETIIYDRASIHRRLDVDLAADSSFLCVEPIILGRRAMGEVVSELDLYDRWRIRRQGELIFADGLRLHDVPALQQAAALGSHTCIATMLFVDPCAEDKASMLRPLIERQKASPVMTSGLSAWNGMALMRLLSRDAQAMRRALLQVIQAIRSADPPRVWTM